MAWTGDVERNITAAFGDGTFEMDCRHRQSSPLSVEQLMRLRKAICETCSQPSRDRISAIRSTVSLDDAIGKIKKLNS